MDNAVRAPIAVCLPETTLTLVVFFFLLDLFTAGLLIVHGGSRWPPPEGDPVPLSLLSECEFDAVARCMAAAGVRCHLDVRRGEEAPAAGPPRINLAELAEGPADLPLPEYVLTVGDGAVEYRLRFELFHFVGDRAGCHGGR